ncbi:hypothetical protein [Planococcus lenghuensis]|uniref:CBS domain-containing protein n=1 Tax=Planococcus lenghuensis TaxID=2213202 RepID=A0A1Q2KW31_9BACL|nr:hypothetical protein [Planococcus lenghuensis]AQQ52401.1 hypothetical protein B0X71_04245 [Planococcus lenghuensis]
MLGRDPSFKHVFTAGDIAEPLASVTEGEAEKMNMLFEMKNFDVIGFEEDDQVIGFLVRGEVTDPENLRAFVHPFKISHLISENTDLLECLHLLHPKTRLFIINKSEVDAIVTISDIQKPAVRMLFFGIITYFESNAAGLIESVYPDNRWVECLSENRRDKALATYGSLHKRNTEIDLISCTQLSDKVSIFMEDDELRDQFIETSKTKADRFFNRIIRLRDDLAHAQSLTNWFEEKEVVDLVSWLIEVTERIAVRNSGRKG